MYFRINTDNVRYLISLMTRMACRVDVHVGNVSSSWTLNAHCVSSLDPADCRRVSEPRARVIPCFLYKHRYKNRLIHPDPAKMSPVYWCQFFYFDTNSVSCKTTAVVALHRRVVSGPQSTPHWSAISPHGSYDFHHVTADYWKF